MNWHRNLAFPFARYSMIFSDKEKLKKVLESYQVDEEVSDEEYQNRLQVLKYGLEQDFNFSTHSIPEEVIDAFVKEIIVYPDCFVWKLNIFDDELRLQVSGRKGNSSATLIESPTLDNGSTGRHQGDVILPQGHQATVYPQASGQ